MTFAGWLGAYVALAGAALLVLEASLAMVMLRRARRGLLSLTAAGEAELEPIREALGTLRFATAQRAVLTRPHRRLWRWYRHPLARAYRESRRRRRAV